MNVAQVITTLIAFSTVMLALSLLITFAVRGIHYLGNVRGATLGEMIGSLDVGYRKDRHDDAEAGDGPSEAFVVDVLTHPALHPAKNLVRPGPKDTPQSIRVKNRKLSRTREYIAQDDLIAIVCRLSGVTYVPGQPVPKAVFPLRWASALPDSQRQLPDLVSYIQDFFGTAEGVTSDEFTKSTRQLTRVLAALLVVFLNMDAFEFAANLYAAKLDPTVTKQTAGQLLDMANTTGAAYPNPAPPVSRDSLLDGLTANTATVASILDQPGFKLGWQQSWLAKAWCVADRQCPPDTVKVPGTWLGWAWSITWWLVGLVTSTILLSLGAPFWAGRLGQLLGWQSALEQAVGEDPPAPKAPPKVPAAPAPKKFV